MRRKMFDAQGRLQQRGRSDKRFAVTLRSDRLVYVLAILSMLLPYGSSAWVAIKMGGIGFLSFGPAAIVFVVLGAWRIILVVRDANRLDAPVHSLSMRWCRRIGVGLMTVAAIAFVLQWAVGPIGRWIFPGGSGSFVIGIWAALLNPLAPIGVLLFEFSRLLSFERRYPQQPAVDAAVGDDRSPSSTAIRSTVQVLLVVAAGLLLTGCAKTVTWEEEVPLNTGETIWVKRKVDYSVQGGAGNPFDMAYRPDWPEVIEFSWGGTRYRYEGDARVMVLAISPQKRPVLVARAGDASWYAKHNYACVHPFYVQLVPDATGRTWTWPSRIETWLYNLPANLLLERHKPEQMKTRYTAEQRKEEDYPGSVQNAEKQRIDPSYVSDICRTRR